MKTRDLLWLVPVLALGVLRASAQSGTAISVSNAKVVRTAGMSSNGTLSGLVSALESRQIVQYANTLRTISMPGLAPELQTLTSQLQARVIFQYANNARLVSLAYPQQLVADDAPPVLGTPTLSAGSRIAWTTDEFATSEIQYGSQPGSYTTTVSDPMFVKAHEIRLDGLSPGARYYALIRSIDRTGNESSTTFSFVATVYVYVPLIRR